jgi:hypothetical protein
MALGAAFSAALAGRRQSRIAAGFTVLLLVGATFSLFSGVGTFESAINSITAEDGVIIEKGVSFGFGFGVTAGILFGIAVGPLI